jgi:tetratricopeptide (TPR) repeat protein
MALAAAGCLAESHAAAAVMGLGGAETQSPAQTLDLADAALQAGEADRALALLASVSASGATEARALNLRCRVHLTLEQWDAAASECDQAVRNDPQNSAYHVWLGRALGEKAARASFLNAYSLAKRTRAEFEEAVRLDSHNAEALSDLGDFYRQAPGVVGGGLDKARGVADELDKIEPARAHQLRGDIAEQQKDYEAAEREFKQAIAAGQHPALEWRDLAGFYSRQHRFTDMETAIHSVVTDALHDRHASVALYDGAGLLAETNRDLALAATMLDDYLAAPSKTEEAPAFIAHMRLARLKQQLGDPAAAARERTAALALAHDYKPAQEFRAGMATPQQH